MSSKIAAIQKQLEKAGSATSRQSTPIAVVSEPVQVAAEPKAKAMAPSRVGKVHLGAYLPPDFKKSLMLVRAQTGKNETQLFADALNDLFRAHNVPVVDIK
jgi:hypothetical protein